MRKWSSYNYAFDNPSRFIDPDGMAPFGDIFNKYGRFVQHINNNPNNIYVERGDGSRYKLSQIPTNNMSNRQVLANVVGRYAKEVGITGPAGVANDRDATSSVSPAHTRGDNNGVYVNAKGGTVNPVLDDANNMRNVLIHEKGHVENNNAGVEGQNLMNHIQIYANQMNDASLIKEHLIIKKWWWGVSLITL